MKKAFTLAEVLITLGIIGVIAAMTIPTLIGKYQDKRDLTKLKKVYTTLYNAFNLTKAEYGTPDNWNLESGDMKTQLKILGKYMNKAQSTDTTIFLPDGTKISNWVYSRTCTYWIADACADIKISLPPHENKNSKDRFVFFMLKDKIVPFGDIDQINSNGTAYYFSFDAYKAGRCDACGTAWFLKYENRDYLKCPDKVNIHVNKKAYKMDRLIICPLIWA